MLTICELFEYSILIIDINQAYLQSAFLFKKNEYVKSDILKLKDDQVLQVIKPLCGLADGGDYWEKAPSKHHLVGLGLKFTVSDLSLCYKMEYGKPAGLSGMYVDDRLRAITSFFSIFLLEKNQAD